MIRDPSPEDLLLKREKRINDAIALREPDRVPVMCYFGFFPAKFAGITYEEAMYDYDKTMQSWVDAMVEFEPDAFDDPFTSRFWGRILERLDYRQLRWPGHGVDSMSSFQDVACIRGNVPLSILSTGTQQDVRAYCKKLIDVVGKKGGFIMDAASNLDDAKPENLRAMFEFTKEYGQYA